MHDVWLLQERQGRERQNEYSVVKQVTRNFILYAKN